MKLLQQCFLLFIVVVIPGHNLGNSQVSVNRTIGPTLVFFCCVVAICDLVHDVETIFHLSYVLTASGILF